MTASKALFSPTLSTNLARAASRGLLSSTTAATGLRLSAAAIRPFDTYSRRNFSACRRSQLDYFPPPKNLPHIKLTYATTSHHCEDILTTTRPPAWPHPRATEEQLNNIEVAHREVRDLSDSIAFNSVRFLRWATDLVTGYRHDPTKPYVMSERKWLIRFIFLETVAGVPGMVAGMLRHLRSLRSMKRDNGW